MEQEIVDVLDDNQNIMSLVVIILITLEWPALEVENNTRLTPCSSRLHSSPPLIWSGKNLLKKTRSGTDWSGSGSNPKPLYVKTWDRLWILQGILYSTPSPTPSSASEKMRMHFSCKLHNFFSVYIYTLNIHTFHNIFTHAQRART